MPLSLYVRVLALSIMVLDAGIAASQSTPTEGRAASAVSGQAYPNKPIRIVTTEAGGASDFVSRVIAQGLTGNLSRQVIVENRAAFVATETVANAQPDGYTLYGVGNTLWIGPLLQNIPYDPVKYFAPITTASGQPNMLVVFPSLPANSVKELIALAKTKPGELTYGSSALGTSSHLAGELFKYMAGVNILRVPYKGGGPVVTALIGGQIHLSFPTASAVTLHVKAGRLRALAVTCAQPSALAPGIPTVAAAGLPGYEIESIHGIFAPAKTPAAIVHRLNQEILRVLDKPDVKEKLLNSGVEAIGSSSTQLATTIQSEIASVGRLIKNIDIRAE